METKSDDFAMASDKLKLEIEQGATFNRVLEWKAGTPLVPVDLTGCTARMQARATVQSPEVLIELTTGNGRIVLGGTAGTIILQITAVDTAAINWTAAVYDLEIAFPNSTVKRLVSGKISVSPEVTRDG